MAILDVLDITEAFRKVLIGEHDFTDATRDKAVQQVRHLTEDRVYVGRKPQAVRGAFILISLSDVSREYVLSGELNSATSLVEIDIYAPNRRKMLLIWEGIRQALTSISTTITTTDGTIQVTGCTVESEGEPPPDEPIDGSMDFIYFYQAFFRVTHEIKVPSAIN